MRNSSKVITVVSVIIIIGLGYAYDDLTKPAYDSASTIQGEKTFELSGNVSIGVILPITGDLSSHGAENRDSIKLAINDFNEYLTTNTKNWKIVPVIEDSATNPTVAREKINRLYMEGIDIILGLEASENIRKIKQYVDDNNILIISCCSSSTSLAVDDSIFRLVPDDSNQGDALAKLLQHKGIETVVPIWRNDIWGNDLQIATTNSFKKLGGEMDPGYRYDPDSPESASMLFFDQQVSKYVQQPGDEDKVAVLFLGFGEIENIIKSVVKLENSTLGKVSWFGPGAITKEGRILNDKNSEFLQKNQFNYSTVCSYQESNL